MAARERLLVPGPTSRCVVAAQPFFIVGLGFIAHYRRNAGIGT